jgi:hypothetical protein
VADDREAEARTSRELVVAVRWTRPRPIDLVEPFEDPCLVSGRDACAVVGDEEPNRAREHLPADPDRASGVAVLHRVVREVEQRLSESPGISHDACRRTDRVLDDRDLAANRDRPDPLDAVVGRRLRAHRLERELRLAGLDPREVEKLIHELREVIHLAFDLRGEVPRGRRVVH